MKIHVWKCWCPDLVRPESVRKTRGSVKTSSYAKNIWDNAPGPSNIAQQPPTSPPILEDDKLANMPDITLEEDLQGLEG